MIEKTGFDDYELICDVCEETVDGLETFYEAVDYKKDNGWISRKINGSWQDVCPNCRKEKSNE